MSEKPLAPPRLPLGIRDYLPAGAALRRRIVDACLGTFERSGYCRIISPMFEYADVLALGATAGADAASLRFVEPTSGEVLALRTDITPQIARLVATRYGAEQGPIRFCYEGSVIRRGRAQLEVLQAGVELVLPAGSEESARRAGDCEAIALAHAALRASGLSAPHLDLGHPGIAGACLAALPEPVRAGVAQGLAYKDPDAVARALGAARRGGPSAGLRRLCEALPELYGGIEVLASARRLVAAARLPAAQQALAELSGTLEALAADELAWGVDLGEVRGFDYYTGVRWAAFVPGVGDAIAAGGRYDSLCARYGRPACATGFAVEVEGVAAGLRAAAGQHEDQGTPPDGCLVMGPAVAAEREVRSLRSRGERAACWLGAPISETELRAYAARWGYARVIVLSEKRPGRPRTLG